MGVKEKIVNFLRWSQKYTKTDMIYVVGGSFWWIFGKVGLSIISFVTLIAFANWLPKESYGTYQFVIASLALFAIFTLPGINTALIKSIVQKKEGTLQLALKKKIKWGVIGAFLSLGLAGWYFLQGNNLLAGAFLLGAIFVPLREAFNIFSAFWNGRKRFDLQTKYSIISAGLSTLILIPVIYITNNVLVIIVVFLVSHTFFDWLLYTKTLKQIANSEKDENAISFGKNLTLMNALQTAAEYIDKVIIWNFLGAVPVAIYAFAQLPIQKVRDMLPIVPLALPKLGENKIDEKRKRRVFSKFLKLFVISVPAAAVLVLIAPFLYRFIFPQYLESIVYFQALSLLITLSPFLLLSASLVAEMKKKALYAMNTGAPFLKIILFLALIPYLGIWGIVIAILIAEVLRGFSALYFFLKI